MEHLSIKDWAELALYAASFIGIVPPLQRWMASGRRSKTASLVAQLAQEVLVAIVRRKGVSPTVVAEMEEAIELLRLKLIGVGVSPTKAGAIARDALAGAAHPDSDLVATLDNVGAAGGSAPMP